MVDERTFILHTREGQKLIYEHEAIENALDQEASGIIPCYSWMDKGEAVTPPGWLVWNTWADGCGVVYRREKDGKPVLVIGWPGDFCFN